MQEVNVESLERLATEKKFNDGIVTPEVMYQTGLISRKHEPVKILGNGELKSKVEVTAHAFSKSALAKIEAAGGKATVLSMSKP
jgi:large subunit ribosomal protein L15